MSTLYTDRKCRIFLTLGVISCQSFAGSFLSHPPIADFYMAVFFFLPVVGRWSGSFLKMVNEFLASGHVFPQLLDSQLVSELCVLQASSDHLSYFCVYLGVVRFMLIL